MTTSAHSAPNPGGSLYELYFIARSEQVLSLSLGIDRDGASEALSAKDDPDPFGALDTFASAYASWKSSGCAVNVEIEAAFDNATAACSWLYQVESTDEALVTDAVGREGRKAELNLRDSAENNRRGRVDCRYPKFVWEDVVATRKALSRLNGNDLAGEPTTPYRHFEGCVHEWIAAGLPSKGEKTVALEMSIDAVMRTYESIRSDEFVPNGSTLRRPLSMDQREQLCILFGARASLPDFGPRIPPLDVSPPPARLPAEPSEAAPQPKPVLVDATLQAPVDEADADQTPASESSTAARPSTSTVSLSKSYTLTELIALPIHPTSALFPMLDGDAQRELVSDVRKNGCREPITIGTVNGILTLLDGRNRLAACSLAGVPPTVRVYDKDDSVAFIVSQNLRRRDLDPTRRALIAVELMPMIEVESKARMLAGEKDPGANLRQGSRAPKSSEIAANMVGVSARTVEMAKAVETKAIPDVRVAVADGTLSLATAARAANKPPEQQHEIVKECVAKKTAKAATRTKASTPTNEWQSTSKRSKRPKRASQITESPPDRLDQRQMLLLAPIDDLATELNNGRRYRAIGEINGELWEYLLEGSRLSVGPVNLRG